MFFLKNNFLWTKIPFAIFYIYVLEKKVLLLQENSKGIVVKIMSKIDFLSAFFNQITQNNINGWMQGNCERIQQRSG